MKQLRNLTTLLVCSIWLTGCSLFSWLPWVDEKAESVDEPAKLVAFKSEIKIDRKWRKSVGKGLGKKYQRMEPAILADRIYAADGYGLVNAYDRFSGKLLWSERIGRPEKKGFSFFSRKDTSFVTGGVGVGHGMVLLGSTRAEVVALDAGDGHEIWRTLVSSEVLNKPVVGDDLVFVQTSDGQLVGLEPETGIRRWSFDSQVPILTLRGTSAPVVRNGVVYAGFATGKLVAFKEPSGEVLWEQRVMLPQGRSDLDRIVDIDGTALVTGSAVFAASYQGRIKALRRQDGGVLWERDTSSYLNLSEGYGQVYVIDDKDKIIALDQRNGDVVWEQTGLHLRRLSSPAVFSNYLVTADAEGYLHVLAQSDGRFMGRRKVGDGVRSPIIYADGLFYVLDNGGGLSAFSIGLKN